MTSLYRRKLLFSSVAHQNLSFSPPSCYKSQKAGPDSSLIYFLTTPDLSLITRFSVHFMYRYELFPVCFSGSHLSVFLCLVSIVWISLLCFLFNILFHLVVNLPLVSEIRIIYFIRVTVVTSVVMLL